MARKNLSTLSKSRPEILIGLGVIFIALSLGHRYLRDRSLRLDQALVDTYVSSQPVLSQSPNYPIHISIPWYIDVDIEPQVYVDGEWTVSPNNASYLTASALPGEIGNIIIYGHNKRTIMGNIRALKGYEKITVTLADGTTKLYQVQSMKEVSPTRTELLKQTDHEVLTLYTCSGLMDSKRFVVRAIPVSDPVSTP
jgi:LPXTG-site transpeptidase (sortase) family protein